MLARLAVCKSDAEPLRCSGSVRVGTLIVILTLGFKEEKATLRVAIARIALVHGDVREAGATFQFATIKRQEPANGRVGDGRLQRVGMSSAPHRLLSARVRFAFG